ncbi:MAG: tetratricopeptide (TPR) repeat protein, partial [Gammaproteobacteria bacterium]
MKVLGTLLLIATCLSCGSTRTYRSDPGPFDALPAPERVPLRAAREAFESGDLLRAAAYLEPVVRRHTRNIGVRAFYQDLELDQLRAGLSAGAALPPENPEDAEGVLRERYIAEARAQGLPELWVLAARLEVDGGRALDYLDRAEEIDPNCVWVFYARAWWSFRLRRFQDARAAMDKGLELDPGHLPSLRLLSHMLAGSGDGPEAIRVLGKWLDRASTNPLVPSPQRAEGLVDLALMRVLRDEPKGALELLGELERMDPEHYFLQDVARMELVRAAAYDLRGKGEKALAASRRAAAADPSILLPLVNEALLLRRRQSGSEAEKEAWERVLEEASAPTAEDETVDFNRLLLQLMARIQLGRLEEGE